MQKDTLLFYKQEKSHQQSWQTSPRSSLISDSFHPVRRQAGRSWGCALGHAAARWHCERCRFLALTAALTGRTHRLLAKEQHITARPFQRSCPSVSSVLLLKWIEVPDGPGACSTWPRIHSASSITSGWKCVCFLQSWTTFPDMCDNKLVLFPRWYDFIKL